WLVWYQFFPVGSCRIARQRGHDLEILGAVGVGQNEEDVATLLQIVLKAGFTRRDDLGVAKGIVGTQQAVLRGFMVADADRDPSVRARARGAHEETGIGLGIDKPVVGRVVATRMVENLGWPVVGVETSVAEAGIICVPDTRSTCILYRIGQVGAALQVADPQAVEFRALVVESPQKTSVI